MKAKHFAGLDGLRFISITFVVLHHLFTFKTNFGFYRYDYPVLGLIGLYGIHFFFMGSGFLITYLLLHEHANFGKINLKNFFLRRIFRIWPAYFLLIIIFLFIFKIPFFRIPSTTDSYLAANYSNSNALYLAFLPHIQPFLFPTGPYVHHTYTIGIEEQFYIAWGLLFYFFRRHVCLIFWVILLAVPLLNVLHEYLHGYVQRTQNAPAALGYVNSMLTYIQYSRFSTFAIGSLFGYAYFFNQSWIQYFKMRFVQVGVYLVLVLSIGFGITIPYLQFEFMALLMACLMLVATFKKESMVNYSAGWISYLGKISYGIYLFHIFAIVFACKFTSLFISQESNLFVTLCLAILTLLLSVFFGWVSYNYFEIVFLKLKKRFQRVDTST